MGWLPGSFAPTKRGRKAEWELGGGILGPPADPDPHVTRGPWGATKPALPEPYTGGKHPEYKRVKQSNGAAGKAAGADRKAPKQHSPAPMNPSDADPIASMMNVFNGKETQPSNNRASSAALAKAQADAAAREMIVPPRPEDNDQFERVFFEYMPDILLTPAMAYAGQKNMRDRLLREREQYSDRNDWAMREQLEQEAQDYNMSDAWWHTYKYRNDDRAFAGMRDRAKGRIGSKKHSK